MKKNLSKEAQRELTIISNHMDNDHVTYVREAIDEISGIVADAVAQFAVLKEVMDYISEEVGSEALWEDVTEIKRYKEMFLNLEKLEDTEW